MEEYFNYLLGRFTARGLSPKAATERARDEVIYYLEGVIPMMVTQMCLGFPFKEGKEIIRMKCD